MVGRRWRGGALVALGLVSLAACGGVVGDGGTGQIDGGGGEGDGGGGQADAGPELPPTIPLRAVSFNICGGQCNGGQASALDAAYTLIDDFQPHLVFLQEVCWSQFQAFAAHYDRTYQAGFATILENYTGCGVADCSVNDDDDPNNDEPRCWIGPMVAARGTLIDPEAVPIGGNDNQVSGDKPVVPPRDFHVACAGVVLDDLPTRAMRACSAHFRAFQDPNGVNDAARLEQATNLTGHVAADVAAGSIVVIGGDLDAPPVKASMSPLYALDAPGQPSTGIYYEADQDDGRYYADYCADGAAACRSGAVTLGPLGAGASDGSNKYDYVFFSETSDPASASALPLDVATSDHAFYRALIEVATAPPG
ncbi:MAG TPA: endonuclease/exonuclease/phosphatase family protein [Kofleriaceae bacterium]